MSIVELSTKLGRTYATFRGDLRERDERIDVRERVGGRQQIVDAHGEAFEQRAEEIGLEPQLPCLGTGDRRIELAQFRRHVAFRIGQRLTAYVIGRHVG